MNKPAEIQDEYCGNSNLKRQNLHLRLAFPSQGRLSLKHQTILAAEEIVCLFNHFSIKILNCKGKNAYKDVKLTTCSLRMKYWMLSSCKMTETGLRKQQSIWTRLNNKLIDYVLWVIHYWTGESDEDAYTLDCWQLARAELLKLL